MSNHLRQAVVIARRDFIATVATPAFLMFLLAPLFMLIFAMVGGTGARMIADSGDDAQRLVVIADADYGAYVEAADARIRATFPAGIAPARLERRAPQGGDPEQQARALFTESSIDVSAVLFGVPDTPRIIYGSGARGADYLALLADTAARDRRGGTAPGETAVEIERESYARTSATIGGQQSLGFAALFLLFLLTLLLAGQTVSVLAEEKGNKVIEILAAAVPLEAVFLGKLVGLFGVALLFVAFWGTLAVLAIMALPGSGAVMATLDPAIGFGPSLRWRSSISRWAICCWAPSSWRSAGRPARCARSRCCLCRSPSFRWRCSAWPRLRQLRRVVLWHCSPNCFRSALPSRWLPRARRIPVCGRISPLSPGNCSGFRSPFHSAPAGFAKAF